MRDLSAPAECAAVVKADAYGLGMAAVAPALARAGCQTFFVATLGEAEELRGLLASATIYVLAGLQLVSVVLLLIWPPDQPVRK